MTSERWQRVKAVLDQALDLPPAEREGFLGRACYGDPELRREVQSLIDSHGESGDFLDHPPITIPISGGSAASREPSAIGGQLIGNYRIIRELGRGGMGSVYLAVRADDSYRKQVAIKLLRRGLDGDHILRRFRTERKILASLEHPNIASLLDGGTAEDGSPYFVMEYIDGEPIDRYCDAKRLPTNERLRLFLKVCRAVQFAHENRIIHRDIKPGNILVNRTGEPKLLDFGIAKIVDPELYDTTADPTNTQTRIFTPDYASPEQIRGLVVTEATDIYSLGVLLYELLTGHRPYRAKTRSPHEIAYMICEEEPERPSTAIRRVEQITGRDDRALTSITPETVSQARGTDPVELRRRLSGDLDNIVLMAMRKEPERRYGSPAALADDLLRHLEERPVQARKGTFQYRSLKLLARHHRTLLAMLVPALAAVLITLFLVRMRSPTPVSEFVQTRSEPFTTYTGDESQPAFSPDGTRIAFVWRGEANDNADIFVKAIGQANPTRITQTPAEDLSPAWSPDGGKIAFYRSGKDQSGFYVVPASGGIEQRITEASSTAFERAGSQVEWSRDGASLFIVDRTVESGPFTLYRVPAGGGARQAITSPPPNTGGDCSFSLSPDGQTLAFLRILNSGVNEVFTQPVAGGRAVQLTSDSRWVAALTWTPDGKSIVFASNRMGNPSLWRVPARGGEPVRMPGIGQNASGPAFSRDGHRMAYVQVQVDANLWRADLARRSPPEQWIASTQYDVSPSYSPDGKQIAFRSSRSGSNEIWTCDANGRNLVQLTHFNGPLTGTPRWSPDGKWIAFDSRPEGQAHIYLMPPSGGSPRKLTTVDAENVVASWSRDSKWVYYVSNRSGETQVWKQPVEGGPAVQVTRKGAFAAFEATDGYLYYAKSRSAPGLWRVPLAGGEEAEILPDLKAGYWGLWMPSKRGILYIDKASAVTPPVLHLFNPETKQRTALISLSKPLMLATSAFAVSTDDRYALFTQVDSSSSDIVLAEMETGSKPR